MTFDGELLQAIRKEALDGEGAEKRKMVADMARTAEELKARGSEYVDGSGQRAGAIPGRIYFRWQNMLPGCWQDEEFVSEFLYDNPQCCAPGYRPKPRGIRHGVTYGAGGVFYHSNKMHVK